MDPLRQFVAAWRIAAVVGSLQVACAFLAFQAMPLPGVFDSIWAGGAIATFPAYLLGMCWELLDRARRATGPRAIWMLWGFSATVISLRACFMLWPV